MRQWLWRIIIVLIVVLAGCNDDTTSTSQPTRLSPTATLSPLPTQRPAQANTSPTPSLVPEDSVTVTVIPALQGDGQSVPADSQTRVQVYVRVSTKLADIDLEGLLVYFRVQGGGLVEQTGIPLLPVPDATGEYYVTTTYVAGQTASVTTVTITALVDVPGLGRHEGSYSFDLVREELSLEVGCNLATSPDTRLEVPVHLVSEPNVGGEYRIRASVNDGLLFAPGSANGQSFVDLTLRPNIHTFGYMPPEGDQYGNTELCVEMPDRRSVEQVCRPIVWGAEGDRIEARIEEQRLWGMSQIPEVRFVVHASSGELINAQVLLTYEVLSTIEPTTTRLVNVASEEVLLPNECIVVWSSVEGFVYRGYQPVGNNPWVGRWHLNALGVSQAVEQDFIVAAARRRVVQPQANFELIDELGTVEPMPGHSLDNLQVFVGDVDNAVDDGALLSLLVFWVDVSALDNGTEEYVEVAAYSSDPSLDDEEKQPDLKLWLNVGKIRSNYNLDTLSSAAQPLYLFANIPAEAIAP